MSRALALEDASWCAFQQARLPSDALPGWSQQSYESALSSSSGWFTWCVEDAQHCPQSWALFTCALDEADLAMMVTVPEARRQGLAKRVLMEALAMLNSRGVRTVFLEVAQNNTAALNLYTQCGFEPVGVRKRYYALESGDRVDAILMRLTMDNEDA